MTVNEMTNKDGNDAQQENNESINKALLKPGALLKAAREQRGMSANEVAKALYITRHKVQALEADEYDKLNSHVFVKGYLRKYAPLVGLNGDELVAQYEQDVEAHADEEEFAVADTNIPKTLVPKFVVPATLFGIAAVVLIAFFISSGSDAPVTQVDSSAEIDHAIEQQGPTLVSSPEDPQPAGRNIETIAVETTDDESSRENPLPEVGTAEAKVVAANQSTVAVESSSEPTTMDNAVPVYSATVPSDGANNAELKFEFSEDCWLEVRDSIDNLLYYDVAKAGDNIELQGEPPFSMTLGNAQAVTLYLGDQLINTQPRPGARTAKLVIGESVAQ